MSFLNPLYKWDHNGTNLGGLVSLRLLTTTASTTLTQIFEGNLIVFQNSGYIKLGGSSEAANDLFAGVAAQDVTWTAGQKDGVTAAEIYVPVWTEGEFDFYHASAAITDLGAAFGPAAQHATYGSVAVDDYNATANNVTVGVCVGWQTDRVRLKIDSFACRYEGLAF
jgi:hypothetical protein